MSPSLHVVYAGCIVLALAAGVLGGVLIDQHYLAKPDLLTKKEVREVQVVRCDAAAVKQCLRKRG